MTTIIAPSKQVAFASTSEISGPKSSNESPQLARESDEIPGPERYSTKDLLLLLTLFFAPMIIVSIALLTLLVFRTPWRIRFTNNGSNELPVNLTLVASNAYYTDISQGSVSLVSGWASHAATFVMPYFMILFSYCVAREVALRRPTEETINNTREIHDLLHGLLKGVWKDTWAWFKFTFQGRRSGMVDNVRALHMAAVGMIISCFFAGLLLAGEQWFHLAISHKTLRLYDQIQPGNESDFLSWSSFIPEPDLCSDTLSSAPLDPSSPSDFVPCSLNVSKGGLFDISNPEVASTMLNVGIISVNDSFIPGDWSTFFNDLDTYQAAFQTYGGSANQVATHFDNNTGLTHAFLFYQLGTYQNNFDQKTNYGLDFVAATTSVSTECTAITQNCQLFNATESMSYNLSIPYNCSSIFSGDLNVSPYDGLEQFRGWDTSFYTLSNGFPKNISVASQLNPFYFNVTAAVSSTTFSDIRETGDLDISDGAIVDAGNNRLAFALSCQSTIYDVQYAMINGNITSFNATLSDPRKASIMKAPLQVGFGRHNLFNAANLGVMNFEISIADAMGVSFSQIGVALASGAFNNTLNIHQRYRYDTDLTQVPKAPFWFLVVVCFTYSALGLMIALLAFWLRRTEGYARMQMELLPREKFEIKKLAKNTFSQVKGLVNWGADAREVYERESRFI